LIELSAAVMLWTHSDAMPIRGWSRLLVAVIFAVTTGLGPTRAAAQVYKWVDANGVTNYGPSPPPGVKATPMQVPPAPSASAAAQAAGEAERLKADAQRSAAERAREAARREADDLAAQRNAMARLQGCARARVQLDVLSAGGPVFRYDSRGERVYLPDENRDAVIAHLRGEVRKLCAGLDSDAATRQLKLQAIRDQYCIQARDDLKDLERQGSDIVPNQDMAKAREKVRQMCGME
jgi:hypothetical protein